MTTDTITQTTARPAIVTLDDVRQQLDTLGLDARKTNASVVQKALGRGGMGTVQKHLDALRAELDKPVVVMDGEIPSAPRETLDALWRSAWTAAQAHTTAALATAMLERDQARDALVSSRADVEMWTAAAETAEAAAAAATETADTATAALHELRVLAAAELHAAQTVAAQEAAAAAAVLTEVKAAAAQAATAAAAATALAQREHHIRVSELQAALDRQADKYSDLRTMLDKLTPVAAPAATAPPAANS